MTDPLPLLRVAYITQRRPEIAGGSVERCTLVDALLPHGAGVHGPLQQQCQVPGQVAVRLHGNGPQVQRVHRVLW